MLKISLNIRSSLFKLYGWCYHPVRFLALARFPTRKAEWTRSSHSPHVDICWHMSASECVGIYVGIWICRHICQHSKNVLTYMLTYQDADISAGTLRCRHMSALLCRHADCSISSSIISFAPPVCLVGGFRLCGPLERQLAQKRQRH